MKKEHWTYHWIGLLLLGVAALLTACSDDADTTVEETNVLQLVTTILGMPEEASLDTRAISIPDEYKQYTGSSIIGVYLTTADDETSKQRTFYYADNKWNSLVSVKNDITYYIYGYMPVTDQVSCTISTLEDAQDYSEGAKLIFNQISPLMTEDICVITGVQDVPVTGNPPQPSSEIDLTPGLFQYRGKASGNNYVNLMLDHLYSSVQLKMQVDAKYSQLRTIKLKKVKLKSTLTDLYDCHGEVTLEKNKACTINWTQDTEHSATEKSITLFTSDSEEGETLKNAELQDPIVIDGYFAPFSTIANSLVLECHYDVYDKNVTDEKPDGNLVRKNCVAENKLSNSKLTLSVGTGKRTVLTLTVQPTYLYVLSDPDLDNPTIQVE